MGNDTPNTGRGYRPPQITVIGQLADLTRQVPPGKEVGAIDLTTYLGDDLGSVP